MDNRRMRIAVVGAGGVGGYFGARLAEAGHDVSFVARGRTRDALVAQGLRLTSVAGDFHLPAVRATDSAAELGPVDLVLVCVKSWQVREAAAGLHPLVGPGTVVLPLENGVEASDELAAELGEGPVLGGLCRLISEIVEPGHIRHSGVPPRVELGERRGPTHSARVEAVRAALDGCRGVAATVPEDIHPALWEKFLFIASFSAVGAVCRSTAGEMRGVEPTRALLVQAMEEVARLALARGVRLFDDVVARNMGFVDGLPPHATASMQRDVMEGRPSELEHQSGAVVRLAREAGVAVPAHAFLYAALLPGERRVRGLET
jgi:2-dehydropantoate 2-reductase